jgi:hypothetical protein
VRLRAKLPHLARFVEHGASSTRSAAISGDILQKDMHDEVRQDDRSPLVLEALRRILMDAEVRAQLWG